MVAYPCECRMEPLFSLEAVKKNVPEYFPKLYLLFHAIHCLVYSLQCAFYLPEEQRCNQVLASSSLLNIFTSNALILE